MSHKRKGQLTVSGEWARHLRPLLRRAFWKKERQAENVLVREEKGQVEVARESRGSVEALLARVEALPSGTASVELWVPERITLREAEVAQDIAMAVLLDKLLERNLFPQGFRPEAGGRVYQYRSE
jgi:hypothetical protein